MIELPDDSIPNSEKPNPDDIGPFRLGQVLRRGVRKVEPAPQLIKTVHTEEHDTFWTHFRHWVLRNNVHIYALFLFVVGLSYYIPSRYYPDYTNIAFGIVFAALIITWPVAYEWEKKQDRSHAVIVDEFMMALKEIPVDFRKDDKGLEQRVLVSDRTRRAIYIGRDYQFDDKEPNRIEMKNAQIYDTGWGRICDVSYVDPSGRIIIGEGEGDLPSGIIFKVVYPSRTELSKSVKDADDLAKSGAIPYETFMEFKKRVDEYNKSRDEVIKYAGQKGLSLIDLERMSKKQKSYFAALDQYSMPFWKGSKDEAGMGQLKSMPPSVLLPKILAITRMYNTLKANELDALINRESDKMEAELGGFMDLMAATGHTEEALKQYLVEQRKSLVAVQSKPEKELEEEVSGGKEQ